MASPPDDANMADPQQPDTVLGKRKRDDDDIDGDDDSLFIPEENEMSLVVYGTNLDQDDDVLHMQDEDDDDDDLDGEDSENDEDDEALDDDDDDQEMHMEATEPFPACAIYDNDMPAVVAKLTGIANKAVSVLLPHDCGGKHVTAHLAAANSLMRIPDTKRLRVALIGNAGVGKSSSLNGIVDIANLAKLLAGGKSCTNLPTEYRNPFTGQVKPYAAIIRYHDSNGIRRLLREYLKDFYTIEFEFDEEWDQETCQMFTKRAKTALDTLQMLFRDLEEFSTRQTAKEYLRGTYQDRSRKSLDFMHEACMKMLRGKTIIDGAYSKSYQAGSRGKLRKLIDPVMNSQSASEEPALWPLVKHIS
ncbi:hypothetical protein LTR17_015705 [Elasticomyces elasticus]|nr:hypothetical protein LTR17_015705 [Elasticomyces elasticus]